MHRRSSTVIRGIPTVVPSMHAFAQERDARARAAGNMFWERGNPHYALAPIVELQLIEALRAMLGPGNSPEASWLYRRDIRGDGVNAFDVLHDSIRIPLVERLRQCVDGAHAGFSVVLFAYEGCFGRGEPHSGALWMDHAETLVTPSLAGALRIAI
ncbi:MAG: hypothetical protein MUF07_10710 [Steroidobacteraceae bacterium]|jgi:hypothetical protein|nr:hypothetical protein [Steroidobacteraceae bacterium]